MYNGGPSSNLIRRLRIRAVDEGWDSFKCEEIAGRGGCPAGGLHSPEIHAGRDVEPFDTEALKIAFALCLEERVAAEGLEVSDTRDLRHAGARF